ncbi:hypothetical protein JKA74_05000 [Marivirga sp. S37H4]|uniref:Uncharacterized protein n=1 Tax=Marivirga aurantiaca TaxID=2802615 RepID=A0A935C6I4_9BACT|nr:hypothetical protein [Marivirga aurantiaca]MBK6264385.1 hypothetical protein [Marivirga aurantiaca]
MPDKSITIKIIESLKERPAYILVFSISFIFLSSSFITSIVGAIKSNDYLAFLALGVFIITLISMILVVYRVEPKTEKQKTIRKPISEIENKEINDAINSILDNIENGIDKNNVFLNERIQEVTSKWRAISGNWKDGMFVAIREEYNNVLLSVYRRAKSDIFSTSTEQYNSTWNRELGKAIVKAHENGTANVTRVFLFGKRSEINETHLKKMKYHNDCDKVTVRVFIDDEAPFNFPPEIAKDFTIIDNGIMIGVTQRFDPEDLSATWYCQNENRIDTFNRVKSELMSNSKPLKEILEG